MMGKTINVTKHDIFNRLRSSCQLPNIMEEVIAYKIIEDKAAEVGIKVTTEELQKAADDFRLAKQLTNVKDTQLWLQKHYLSLDDFENLIYVDIISKKLIEHLFSDAVEPWFYQNRLDYIGAVIYEVFLDDRDVAMELFCALKEGEISFHEVARQYITQPALRRAGGYRGVVTRPELQSEISGAVFAANPPEFLKPIITSTGVHLILVEEIIEPELDEQMRTQILGELFSRWLQQQVQEREIKTDIKSDFMSANNDN